MTKIAFYRLSRKIVNNQDAIPPDAQQVVYYSLAIGHHVGVMDCLDEIAAVPDDQYARCLQQLPDGEARHKLEGALKWQEIEINRSHADALLPALSRLLPGLDPENSRWVGLLIQCLHEIVAEPAMYLMARARE